MARSRGLGGERLLLVVDRLQPRRAKHGLAKPLQAEHEQQRANHEPQRVQGQRRERRTERRDDRPERQHRRSHPAHGRRPAARQPDGEHDRQRLDRLDRAGEKH